MSTVKLYNDDYLKALDNIPDGTVDLVVTDPPYKFTSTVGGGFYAKDNPDKQREYLDSLQNLKCADFNAKLFLYMIKPKMKKIYVYAFCNKYLLKDYIQWAEDNKCSYDILVMAKSNPIPACNNHYMSDLEYIVIIRGKNTYFSKEKDLDLYRKWFLTSCKKGLHPAQKPLDLIKRFVTVACTEGGTVLDCFMGSGTTGVACKNLNRDFIGIEIDKKYFDIAKARIEGKL